MEEAGGLAISPIGWISCSHIPMASGQALPSLFKKSRCLPDWAIFQEYSRIEVDNCTVYQLDPKTMKSEGFNAYKYGL